MSDKDIQKVQEGYYIYKGDLVHLSKERNGDLVLRSQEMPINKKGTISKGQLIYSASKNEALTSLDFNYLIPTDPYDFYEEKAGGLFKFIQAIEKSKIKTSDGEHNPLSPLNPKNLILDF